MSTETAYQIQYRQEFVLGFERRQSLLRGTVTSEAVLKGSSAVFNVVDSNGETTTTRGVNGLIQAFGNHNTQNTCTLSEQHALGKITGFNVFASQGNQTAQLQANQMAKLNRKIDDQIITELYTGTQYAGLAAETMTLSKVAHALAIIGNNDVPIDGDIYGLLSPAAYSYMLQVQEFANSDYVAVKPLAGRMREFYWAGVNWIVHTGLASPGTASEKAIVYHKTAIGHAVDAKQLDIAAGYDGEQQYSWARASGFMGAKLLQNNGVVIIRHDGLGYSATA